MTGSAEFKRKHFEAENPGVAFPAIEPVAEAVREELRLVIAGSIGIVRLL